MSERGKMSEDLKLGNVTADMVSELIKPKSHIVDIGGGDGRHSMFFAEKGHSVIFNDLHDPEYEHELIRCIICPFMSAWVKDMDVAWISHVLEHQVDVNAFLTKVARTVKEGGIIAICIPPAKHQIVSGHVTLWNAGLVLYNLVLAGLDCSMAMVLQHGYNISVIIKKKRVVLPSLGYDYGDLTNLKKFFPNGLEWNGDSFNGDIHELNWNL